MDSSLHELLSQVKDNKPGASHVTFIPQQQFHSIRRDRLGEFWEGYSRIVYKGEGIYSLAEMNQRDMPVVTIMTFEFNQNEGTDLFTDKFLLELIYAWQKAIDDKLYLSENRQELICVVLESERAWNEGNITLYQVRLQFPLCKTDAENISRIRERAISILRRRNATRLLEVSPENDWEKIIDPNTHFEPLLLYKSVRSNRPKMTLSGVYDEVTEEHMSKDYAQTYDLRDAFDPRYHSDVVNGLVSDDIFDESDAIYWLPLILSINYTSSPTFMKEEPPKVEIIKENTPLGWALHFMQMLSLHRSTDYFSWKDIGRALYSSSEGSEEGLNYWIKFTSTNDSFTSEECTRLYSTFEREPQVTYRTLAWYAKQDTEEDKTFRYKFWHERWCDEALEKALELQHYPIGEYFYRLYWLEIACSNPEKMIWYTFNGVRWRRQSKFIAIARRLTKEVIGLLEQKRSELCSEVCTILNPVEKKPFEDRIKAFTSLISKLNDEGFVNKVIKTSAVPFHSEYECFKEYADTNPSLMAHADCVTEADESEITIRKGKPEDYITMTTGMRLLKERFTWSDPRVKEVMEWIKKLHVNEELRKEFLKEISSWLRGGNINKRISIWSGGGDNSKSMFVRLLELAFGEYIGKLPVSLFVGKRSQTGNATPELARAKGKHLMISQELDEETEQFRKAFMKETAGMDSTYTRTLYDEGGEVQFMFFLIFVCNKIPRFIGVDRAIKQRVKIIPFLSTWSDDAPDDPEEQFKTKIFKRDPYFEVRIPQLAAPLLWVLIQYYPTYIKEGLKEPKLVKDYTRKYWEDQDYYQQYIDNCLEFAWNDNDDPDNSVFIPRQELFRNYKNWLFESVPGVKPPASKDVFEAFNKRLSYDENTKRWIGVRILRDFIPDI